MNVTRFTAALLACVLLTSCTRDGPPSEVVQARKPRPYHTVKTGETTQTISQSYNMTEKELISINRLKAPYTLFPGQRLIVMPREAKNASKDPMVGPGTPQKETEIAVQSLEQPQPTAEPIAANPSAGTGMIIPSTPGTPSAPGAPSASIVPSTTAAQPEVIAEKAPERKAIENVSSTSYEWPVQGGKVTQNFGQKLKDGSISEGINISAPKGTPVIAVANGVVKDAGQKIPAYGNMVVVKLNDGRMVVYAHLDKIDSSVKVGSKVTHGQTIGLLGDTGVAKGKPQLHFEVRDVPPKVEPLDPMQFLK